MTKEVSSSSDIVFITGLYPWFFFFVGWFSDVYETLMRPKQRTKKWFTAKAESEG